MVRREFILLFQTRFASESCSTERELRLSFITTAAASSHELVNTSVA
jgi:hypothetical protein